MSKQAPLSLQHPCSYIHPVCTQPVPFYFSTYWNTAKTPLPYPDTPQSPEWWSIWTSFLYIVSSIECVLYLDTKVTKTVMIQRRSLVFRSVLHYESIWIWMWHSDPLWGTYPLYKRLKGLHQAHLSICIIMRQYLHFSNIFKTKLDLQLSPRS